MVRYFPDPKTAPIAQFLRGNLQIVAPLSQISTQVGNVLEFDIKANEVTVSFTPTYTSNALSLEDTVAINLAIQNALRTSFQPSSATLPGSVAALQFKTMLSGAQKAGALLLNLTSHSSTPASVQDIVLNAADDFAFAISPSYINSLLSSSIGQFSTFTPIPVSEWPFSATYTVTLTNPPPALNFTSGAIQLIINAHAHSSGSIFPSFNFRTVVSLGLNLIPIDASGRLGAAELVLSKVALDFTDSGLGGDLKDLILGAFKGTITNNVANAVNNTLNSPDPNGIQATVRKQTNIDTQLGNLVNSLLTDPSHRRSARRLAQASVLLHFGGHRADGRDSARLGGRARVGRSLCGVRPDTLAARQRRRPGSGRGYRGHVDWAGLHRAELVDSRRHHHAVRVEYQLQQPALSVRCRPE